MPLAKNSFTLGDSTASETRLGSDGIDLGLVDQTAGEYLPNQVFKIGTGDALRHRGKPAIDDQCRQEP